MELIWLVLALVVVDLAAFLFAADTRPGLQHSARPGLHRSIRHVPGSGGRSILHTARPGLRRSIGG
jgi:hypothetical protein